ncbi:MAG TPA: serine/threonine-protein kinase, partial [Polyangiaceae bacterium]|nr:serine/threonine-protein kinase [Polyangiaceae bacterium]
MEATSTKKTVDIRREVKLCAECRLRFSRDAGFCPFDGTRLVAAPFDPLADRLIGARIDGRYDVVSILGEGGMGRVYQVRHAALDRAFAMKVLRPELAKDDELASRFILEAKATASVKHPSVVQITDFGRMPDDVPYFVMELLVGQTLRELLEARGPMSPARATPVLRKVAGALAAAHAAGVVHRDLKPDNVFLVAPRDSRAGEQADVALALAALGEAADVRVVDFGSARIVGTARQTRSGVVFGTPHYMAPEQASGHEADHRADVYALGVIMYEMITGRVPFEADTYMGVLTQHIFVKPVPPSQAGVAATPAGKGARELAYFEPVVLRCLEKKPEDRFASMDEVLAAIDTASGAGASPSVPPSGRPSRASPRLTPWGGAPPELAVGGSAALPTLDDVREALRDVTTSDPPPPRSMWVFVGVLGLATALLVAAAARWATSRGVDSVPVPLGPSAAAAG